jgi:hypothetical protein
MDIDFAFRARVMAIVRQALQPTAGCTQPEIFLSLRQYIIGCHIVLRVLQ